MAGHSKQPAPSLERIFQKCPTRVSLQDMIEPDNEVRVIDCFVDSLELSKMDFKVEHGENGRPAYHPSDLLKLFIYGYLNRIRSSRRLEKECKRNIEVIWLLKTLQPDHNTIANFRRDNSKAGFSYILTKKTKERASADTCPVGIT